MRLDRRPSPSSVPVTDSNDSSDVQFVISRAPIFSHFVDANNDLRRPRRHPVNKAQDEWCTDALESLGPILLDLPILNFLAASNNLPKPLTPNSCCELV